MPWLTTAYVTTLPPLVRLGARSKLGRSVASGADWSQVVDADGSFAGTRRKGWKEVVESLQCLLLESTPRCSPTPNYPSMSSTGLAPHVACRAACRRVVGNGLRTFWHESGAATPVPKTAHAPGEIPPITKTQAAVLVIPYSPAVASASRPTAVGSRTTSKTSRGAWSLDGGAGPVGLRPPATLTVSAMAHAAAFELASYP